MSNQINRLQSNRQRPEKTFNGSLLNEITATTMATSKLIVLGSDVKEHCALFIFCLQILLVIKTESVEK
jgi:hypothetical protein